MSAEESVDVGLYDAEAGKYAAETLVWGCAQHNARGCQRQPAKAAIRCTRTPELQTLQQPTPVDM